MKRLAKRVSLAALFILLVAILWAGDDVPRTLAQQALDAVPLAAVCAYSSSPPTVTSGNFVYVQCNSSGELLLH